MSHYTSDYASLLRNQGYRVTPQRQMILDAVCTSGGHSTVEEVYRRVRAKAPTISPATIYRTLDLFCELGLVVSAQGNGRQMCYEIADETPHHHLICRQCGRVDEIGNDLVENFARQIEQIHGFAPDVEHLMLAGLCSDCRQGTGP